jgi:hypothetical protein
VGNIILGGKRRLREKLFGEKTFGELPWYRYFTGEKKAERSSQLLFFIAPNHWTEASLECQ